MGEQRFKVGDWVRSLVDWGDIEAGKVYKIPHIDGDGEPRFTPDGTGGWTDYLTLDEIEPWQPLVGERVRFTDKVPSFWFFGPAKEYKDGVIKSLNSEGYRFCVKTGGAVGHVNIEHIEPIITAAAPDKPTTLKIEAGKFYKTRDGRKAKIERSHYGDSYDFVATVEGLPGNKVYKKDGKHGSRWIANNPSDDLIAEWIDEPVTKPSNDNAKPKFKVGDRVEITANDNCRVNFVGSFGTIKTAPANAVAGFRVQLDDGREFPFWPSEMTVRPRSQPPTTSIVALIENGQPKPSSTPHVHTSTGSAEKEAKRLAAKYKGQQFGVFKLTATHREERVYEHKWQNMAALGLKSDAIKELRAVAGIPQGHAERIVGQFAA